MVREGKKLPQCWHLKFWLCFCKCVTQKKKKYHPFPQASEHGILGFTCISLGEKMGGYLVTTDNVVANG